MVRIGVVAKIKATRKGERMKHKNLVIGGLLTATLLGGGAFALSASAATNGSDTLASKIATKFNLNKDDVQKVIDENHAERHAEHQAEMLTRLETRLTQAVKDGKLTEEQKTKILDYVKTQESFFESLKDKSEEERQTAMKAHREEIKKWASDNGIDEQYVLFDGSGGRHGDNGMRGGDGQENQ